MSLLKPSTKALALSCKVSVRTDTRGFLSLQYLVRNDDGQICFVEYYCCPDEEVDEEQKNMQDNMWSLLKLGFFFLSLCVYMWNWDATD